MTQRVSRSSQNASWRVTLTLRYPLPATPPSFTRFSQHPNAPTNAPPWPKVVFSVMRGFSRAFVGSAMRGGSMVARRPALMVALPSSVLLASRCAATQAQSSTVVVAPGVQKEVLKAGTGEQAKAGQRASVHYTGSLTSGKVFDSSRTRGTPFQFTLGAGEVIKVEGKTFSCLFRFFTSSQGVGRRSGVDEGGRAGQAHSRRQHGLRRARSRRNHSRRSHLDLRSRVARAKVTQFEA
jgi:hypothetical protein